MNQATFNFAPTAGRIDPRLPRAASAERPGRRAAAAAESAEPGDALGFEYARYGLVPPAPCLWPGHPIREGWERGRGLFGRRTRAATLAVTRWLALRLTAWERGEAFDDHEITPQLLRSLEVATLCPVTGRALQDDAMVVPVDAARGWRAGNLALMSPAFGARWVGIDWEMAKDALARAESAPQEPIDGIALRQWRRVVALKSLATPLPHAEAARIPLHVLPPNRLRLVNPIQELQAVLTLQLSVPGWGQRAGGIAESMPASLRNEFNLFFNSLLAQALRQGHGARHAEMRGALAAAWGDAVVQRRWERFARLVDAALAETLVERLAREPMPGLYVVRHGRMATQAMAA
ncbi:MAG: hypothetical protein ABW032_03415 [Burkholderiaceae bacterium]